MAEQKHQISGYRRRERSAGTRHRKIAVGKDGAIHDPKVLRSVDPSLDKEALRVVKAMPRWIPGKQNGVAVAVYFTLPVTFQLQ